MVTSTCSVDLFKNHARVGIQNSTTSCFGIFVAHLYDFKRKENKYVIKTLGQVGIWQTLIEGLEDWSFISYDECFKKYPKIYRLLSVLCDPQKLKDTIQTRNFFIGFLEHYVSKFKKLPLNISNWHLSQHLTSNNPQIRSIIYNILQTLKPVES